MKQRDGYFAKYPTCGALIGAVREDDTDTHFYVHCPQCHTFWLISVDFYGEIEVSKQEGRINLTDKMKVIECRE